LLLAAGIWDPLPVNASLIFSLTPPSLTGAPGDVLQFIGTLQNSGATDVFLNGTETSSPARLTVDSEPFFANTPLSLGPGGSFSGGVFDIHLDPAIVPGSYTGSFAIRGGDTAGSFDILASAEFSVRVAGAVQAVAEPDTAYLIATALLIGWALSGRRAAS
jgi:hypothetical protein